MSAAGMSPEWWRSCAGAVTGIGSLPFEDVATAIDFVAETCPRLPFCPQPPGVNLVEVTLGQFNEPQGGRPEMHRQFARAALAGAFPSALALKTQVTGPITLAGLLGLRGPDARSADLVTSLASSVAHIAARQVQTLSEAGLPVVVYVDEPALVMAESATARRLLVTVFAAIEAAGGLPGIHCCAALVPELPGLMGSAVVSFDATADLLPNSTDQEILSDPDRVMSYGLVGVTGPIESAASAFSRWLAMAAQVGDPATLARRTVLTPSCGLGGSTVAEAEEAFRVAAAVSDLVAAVALGRTFEPVRTDRPRAS